MVEFNSFPNRPSTHHQEWSPQEALNVLSRNAFDFPATEERYQKDGLKDKEQLEGPLAKGIENADTPVFELFDSFKPHKANETVERDTSYSDKSGPKVAGKLTLHYDSTGQPASAEFRDNLGNDEALKLDSTHSYVLQDQYHTATGTSATFDFNGVDLTHEKIETPTSTSDYSFDGGRLSHHIFTINGESLELTDNKKDKTIIANGPVIGRNPIITEKYDYDEIHAQPRTIEFTVANGKQYRGQQLPDGRWKVSEVK
jgi:hypothetical protein